MRKIIVLALSVVCLSAIGLQFSSCGKEDAKPPTILLDTSSALYISRDTALLHGSAFNVGVSAGKSGSEDMLSSMTFSISRNGATDSIFQQMFFTKQSFYQFYTYRAPDSGNVDRYTFTVAESAGMTNSVSLSITGL